MSYTASLLSALPEVILTVGALALLMVSAFGGDRMARLIGWLAVALFAVAGVAAVAVVSSQPAFDGLYHGDSFAVFAKILIYVAAAASILIAPDYFERGGSTRAEYPVLILLAGVGMGMMVSAGDMLTLYVGFELQNLAAYVLASFMRRDMRSAEAGLKYFVLGALASGILLYGITLLYGFSGTTVFTGIAASMRDGLSIGHIFGMVFVIAGLAFKISAVPFHMWAPDVYEGAPTPVTAMFATMYKVAAMALLVRVCVVALGSQTEAWRQVILFAALASTILGAVAAIVQTNIKRLLAYSSINNAGFALFGLAAGTEAGVAATMTYLAVYIAMTMGSFICVLRMRDADGNNVQSIASMSGMSRTRPGLAAAFAIFMFSLAGIPPLLGLWPKLLVFDALVKVNLAPIAAVGIATSVLGAVYYLKIVKTMYFDEPAAPYATPTNRIEGGLIALSALAVSPLGYLAVPALGVASMAAAKALF
ncbi:MAG TPA: NADH-quinone oxidoreductase subunit NuoN [Sphingomonadaceae bacterium]|nr:NADH-quinone oxidoreductase subunit NuoN [Sphingomonadaceae bacterium]